MNFDQEGMIFFPEVLPPEYRFDFPVPFEEINLKVKGATINALYFKIDNPKGAVLYFHGNAGSLSSWGYAALDFTSRSYNVFIVDYRGYGKSTGRIMNESMLHDDAAAAYEYVKNLYPEEQIILYGRSIGTGIACYLATQNKPHMLILESPYYSLKDIANRFIPFMPAALIDKIFKYPLRTDLWIPHVQCPIYIFHGMEDEIIPFNSSRRLVPLIKSEHELIAIPGGGHNDLINYPLYHEGLDRILKSNIP
ncbi:MAG: alpha/beta fold hydrolase [Deltaproteobacteria bacterium]|nr:alpha/beta fold hydrolase [Deltaproteobacteria bacterium]